MSDWAEIETRVCKANPLGSFQNIVDQVIVIKGQIPRHMTLDECENFHERQALMINKALRESLPQGTYDRLGIMFMMHKVSLSRKDRIAFLSDALCRASKVILEAFEFCDEQAT